jgi:hypothetical protein
VPVPPAAPVEPHTAPHDEIVSIVRELVLASPEQTVSIDSLANALKSRGFRRPPGSPRLLTRLRRIREVHVSSSGAITLAEGGEPAPPVEDQPDNGGPPAAMDDPGESGDLSEGAVPAHAAAEAGGEAPGTPGGTPGRSRRRRRRRWRGGHRPAAAPGPATG